MFQVIVDLRDKNEFAMWSYVQQNCALSLLFFSLEMAVNPGWSGSNLVLILFQGLWCNEVLLCGTSWGIWGHRKEQKCLKISCSAVRINWWVTLLLDQGSVMAFSHMDYQRSGNVTRVHQRMKGFLRCPGSQGLSITPWLFMGMK